MKINCTWLIQSNLAQQDSDKLIESCKKFGKPYKLFKVVPFTTRMPRICAIDPFVLYGSTTLNFNAYKSKKYKKGVFFNPRLFRPTQYKAHYGEYFLNNDLQMFRMKDIPKKLYPLDKVLFIRSNDDSKQISGGTVTFEELLNIQKTTEEQWISGDIFTPESQVCIATEKEMYSEYRIIIVGKRAITGSRYRPSINAVVPDEITEFAEKMARIWVPNHVCVMDICECNLGIKLIECNCFNGSGYYHADRDVIVSEISKFQEERYNK